MFFAANSDAIAFYRAFGARLVGEGSGEDFGDLIFALTTDAIRDR